MLLLLLLSSLLSLLSLFRCCLLGLAINIIALLPYLSVHFTTNNLDDLSLQAVTKIIAVRFSSILVGIAFLSQFPEFFVHLVFNPGNERVNSGFLYCAVSAVFLPFSSL